MISPLELARRNSGLTQEELAAKAGLAQSAISRAEQGQQPLVQNAVRIASALGVAVESLWPLEIVADEATSPTLPPPAPEAA